MLEIEILEVLVAKRSRETLVKWRKKKKQNKKIKPHANCEFTQLDHSALVYFLKTTFQGWLGGSIG